MRISTSENLDSSVESFALEIETFIQLNADIFEIRTVLSKEVVDKLMAVNKYSTNEHHAVLKDTIRSSIAKATVQLQSIVYTLDKTIASLEADLALLDEELLKVFDIRN